MTSTVQELNSAAHAISDERNAQRIDGRYALHEIAECEIEISLLRLQICSGNREFGRGPSRRQLRYGCHHKAVLSEVLGQHRIVG